MEQPCKRTALNPAAPTFTSASPTGGGRAPSCASRQAANYRAKPCTTRPRTSSKCGFLRNEAIFGRPLAWRRSSGFETPRDGATCGGRLSSRARCVDPFTPCRGCSSAGKLAHAPAEIQISLHRRGTVRSATLRRLWTARGPDPVPRHRACAASSCQRCAVGRCRRPCLLPGLCFRGTGQTGAGVAGSGGGRGRFRHSHLHYRHHDRRPGCRRGRNQRRRTHGRLSPHRSGGGTGRCRVRSSSRPDGAPHGRKREIGAAAAVAALARAQRQAVPAETEVMRGAAVSLDASRKGGDENSTDTPTMLQFGAEKEPFENRCQFLAMP